MKATQPSLAITYIVFIAVILIWGIGWPIMKMGVANMPPIWFGVGRLFIGCVCLFAYLIFTKQFKWPVKADLPIIATVGILQMALYLILINVALSYVEAGRSSILSYVTPLFVVPIAVLFFKEKLSKLKLLGLMASLLGVLILFNPRGFDWSNHQNLFGNGLLLLTALCWSIAILHSRYGHWRSSLLVLCAWELLLATVICLILACILEPHPVIQWNFTTCWILAYTGILCSAFGYWGAILVANRLSPMTTSIGFLGVPLCGILSAAVILKEPLRIYEIISLALIMLGVISVVVTQNREKNKP